MLIKTFKENLYLLLLQRDRVCRDKALLNAAHILIYKPFLLCLKRSINEVTISTISEVNTSLLML